MVISYRDHHMVIGSNEYIYIQVDIANSRLLLMRDPLDDLIEVNITFV